MSKSTCLIDGCDDPPRCRGWCNKHYWRWRRTGDPLILRVTLRPPRPPCSINDCDKPVKSLGWCNKHYQRWLKYGDPLITKLLRLPLEQRFWAWVDKRGPDECWPWKGFIGEFGYGSFSPARGLGTSSHRMAYRLTVGPVRDDLELDHLCHTRDLSCAGGVQCLHRRCCNPAHLEPVTRLENTRRSRRYAQRGRGRSPYKGVVRSRNGWVARIGHEREVRYLGYFATEEDAARAYDAAARELRGEFARLNFPDAA